MMERGEMIDILTEFTASQIDLITTKLELSQAFLPGPDAPPAARASALMQLVEQRRGPGLSALAQAIQDMIGGDEDAEETSESGNIYYLANRHRQVNPMLDTLTTALTSGTHQLLLCLVLGDWRELPHALVHRFRIETFPNAYEQAPGSNRIPDFEVGSTTRRDSRLEALCQRLKAEAKADTALPEAICDAINHGRAPRAYAAHFRSNTFGAEEEQLIDDWLDFWCEVAHAGLNEIVTLILCFHQYPDSKPTKPKWWSRPFFGGQRAVTPATVVHKLRQRRDEFTMPNVDDLESLNLSDIHLWIQEEVRQIKGYSDYKVTQLVAAAGHLVGDREITMSDFVHDIGHRILNAPDQ